MSLRHPSTPLEVTEWLLRQPAPYSVGMVVNRPAGGMSVAARLFQARMWRGYALAWRGERTPWGERYPPRWMEEVFRTPPAECIRRARVNLYLARRLNRAKLVEGEGSRGDLNPNPMEAKGG